MAYTPMPLRLQTERLILTPEIVDEARERIAAMEDVVARVILGAAFATGRDRIWATVGADNAPSFRVLDKLGFRRDHLEADERGEIVYLVRDAAG